MDPEANLKEQRVIVARLLGLEESDDCVNHTIEGDAIRLAELVNGMDHWLIRGGFLPGEWSRR